MQISISLEGINTLTLKYNLSGKLYLSELKVEKADHETEQFILQWLMNETRSIFDVLPFKGIALNINQQLYKDHTFSMSAFIGVLHKTNDYLENIISLKNTAINSEGVLFFGADNDRYNSFYKWLQSRVANCQLIIESNGFDSLNRVFKESKLQYTIDDIVKIIREGNIGKVVSINFDTLSRYFSQSNGVNIYTLLNFLGVELVTIHNDPADLTSYGQIMRAAIHRNTQFTNMGVLSVPWDNKHKKPLEYIALPHDYRKNDLVDLSKDYKVIILSNSRWNNVQSWLNPIMALLDRLEDPLVNLPIWYLSVHKLLQVKTYESIHSQSILYRNLHLLFYHTAQYLKFEIIKNIKTTRKLEVYGDKGWEKVCPNIYSGNLSVEQMNKMYTSNENLFLLLNFGFTYLDHSGPVYDVIQKGVNWINVPTVARTSELENLSNLEYSNYTQLNELLENAKPKIQGGKDSILNLRRLYKSSASSIITSLETKSRVGFSSNRFTDSFAAHFKLLDVSTDQYIDANEKLLRDSIYNMSKLVIN